MSTENMRREQILDAAERYFFHNGFRRCRLEDIAGDLGLVKSAIYKYFPGKRELFLACINRIAESHFIRMDKARQLGETVRDTFEKMFDSILDSTIRILDGKAISPEIWLEMKSEIEIGLKFHHKQAVDVFTEVILEGVQRNEIACRRPTVAAELLNISMDEALNQIFMGNMTFEQGRQKVKEYLDLIFEGLTKRN